MTFDRAYWRYLFAPRAPGAPGWLRVINCRRSSHLEWWYVEVEPLPTVCPRCKDPVPEGLAEAYPGYQLTIR